ncbi:MAG: hypothetical protein H7343_11420 [Undibacterium sp.]|nr:hypothetical protein [Opitutaceae bacterium]
MTTLEECHAAQDRQDALKSAHRKDLGGMTRGELFDHADSPAKQRAAESLWSRREERNRQATAGTPPVTP